MTLQSLKFPLEENFNWVVCPACKEEWSKLKTSIFFHFDGERTFRTSDNSCVECAETTKNFKWWVSRYPFISVFDNWGPLEFDASGNNPTLYPAFNGEMVKFYSNTKLVVNCREASTNFIFTTLGGALGIELIESTNGSTIKTTHDSFPSAWSWMKKRLNERSQQKIDDDVVSSWR